MAGGNSEIQKEGTVIGNENVISEPDFNRGIPSPSKSKQARCRLVGQ